MSSLGTGRISEKRVGEIRNESDQGYVELHILSARDLRVPHRAPLDHHIKLTYKDHHYQTSTNWFDERLTPHPITLETFKLPVNGALSDPSHDHGDVYIRYSDNSSIKDFIGDTRVPVGKLFKLKGNL